MGPDEIYAMLMSKIDNLEAESIGAAVTAFLQDNPEYFTDLLGLYKDSEGYICQMAEGGN
jgi:hypothetical protein